MHLRKAHIKHYRALEDVALDLRPVNVFFGPNAAGKSSFLDALRFVHDCAVRSVSEAAGDRDHGIGLLWDEEGVENAFTIELETAEVSYQLSLALAAGRIDPMAGEVLDKAGEGTLIWRAAGNARVGFNGAKGAEVEEWVDLREPQKLALARYLDSAKPVDEAISNLDQLLRHLHLFDSRELDLRALRRRGSEGSYGASLTPRATNLWTLLRHLHDRRSLDERFDTITEHMRRAFPKFSDVVLMQVGASVVTGNFLEHGRSQPIPANGVSDGFLQMLILLTALFSEDRGQPSILMFDEPEISLHPHAIAELARAIEHATEKWNRQVMLATHSPVLLSQFDAESVVVVEPGERGEANFRRVSEISEVEDLLDQYALGSLYMAEAVGAQSGERPPGDSGS